MVMVVLEFCDSCGGGRVSCIKRLFQLVICFVVGLGRRSLVVGCA